MILPKLLFWVGIAGVIYPYAGYPILLWLIARFRRLHTAPPLSELPAISMIIPIHNEAPRLQHKIANTSALRYPSGSLQVIFVSDGSTDETVRLFRSLAVPGMEIVELPQRRGKAAALNAGLTRAKHDILVFSDASIALEPDALENIVQPFADGRIGCVSGEDRIAGNDGEAWYGRYELLLRRLESRVHSIVGASGSFYAQRRSICDPFSEAQAPDFLSVLKTVQRGFRAVSEPSAIGTMTSVKDPRLEFERKVRTLLRGMTTLFAHPGVLNPFRVGAFAFAVFSHKLMRWAAPVFLAGALIGSMALLSSVWYAVAFFLQVVFYLVAAAALWGWKPLGRSVPGRLAVYFSTSNAAVVAAWYQYGRGVRQELWTPTRR